MAAPVVATSPTRVTTGSGTASTISTGSFTPPGNSVLVATLHKDGSTPSNSATFSGGGLTWTRLQQTQATNGACAIGYAVVPSGGIGSMTVTGSFSGASANNYTLKVDVITGVDSSDILGFQTSGTYTGTSGGDLTVGPFNAEIQGDSLMIVAATAAVTSGSNSVTPTATGFADWDGFNVNSEIRGGRGIATSSDTATYTIEGPSTLTYYWNWVAVEIRGVTQTGTLPDVNAGTDVTGHTVGTEFSRTAIENDGGSAITSREWRITDGPASVNTVLSTTDTVNWSPNTVGVYTLQYSATNAVGTSSDSMTLEVVTVGAQNPGDVLNIGTAAGRVHFGFDVAEAGASNRVLYEPSQIDAGLDIDPEFTHTSDGQWTQCSVRADAPTTSENTAYARVEGREYQEGSDTSLGFNPKDGNTHWMRFRSRITEAPAAAPHIATGQLHSGDDDIVMVRTRLVNGFTTLVLRTYDPGSNNTIDRVTLDPDYTLGDIYDLLFLIHGGRVYIFYQDFTQPVYDFDVDLIPSLNTYFFKMGAYLQFNESTSGVNSTDWGTVHIRNAAHWHTTWAQPQNYFGCPEVNLGDAATVEAEQEFTRTATETGDGITERKWAILSGPDGAGTSIGTSAALSWTPTIPGDYTLIYGAKNDQGWSNPTFLNVTVSPASGGAGGGVRSRRVGKSPASNTHDVLMPPDAEIGDRVFVGFVNDHADADPVVPSGWASLGRISQGTTTNHTVTVLTRILTGSSEDNPTISITDPNHSNSVAASWVVVCLNGDSGATPTATFDQGGSSSGNPVTAPSGTLPNSTYDSIIFLGLDNNTGVNQSPVPPTGWSNLTSSGVSSDAIYAYSVDAQLENVTSINPGSWGWNPGEQWVTAHVVMEAMTAVAPTVSAGVDDIIDQFDDFVRTAIENDGGAPITARSWRVISGPNEVDQVIGTTATLNWSPTVPGTYVIRYSASNSVGTGIDDVEITVNGLNFPVTGNLILDGTQSGLKNVSSSETGHLQLDGTSTGRKEMHFSPTAALQLTGSASGHKINVGYGVLKLHAAAINVGRPGAGAVTARLKLFGSAGNASHVTDNVDVTQVLHLDGVTTGTKSVPGAATGNLVLDASIADAFKNVPVSPSGVLLLGALVTDVSHNSFAEQTAEILLSGDSSGGEHHTLNVPVSGNLNLGYSSVTSSVRFNRNVFKNLILDGQAFGQRIITEVSRVILPRADNTTKYELVVVARIPQTSGPPAFFEVDPLDWKSITYSEELNGIPALSGSAKITSLTNDIKLRLQALHDLPTELWLYRNGKHVFAGPLLGFNAQDEDSISLEALGLMAYTQMWHITKDITFTNVDQFDIVKALINQWQELEYGHYGIDTTDPITSGVMRTITYNYKEIHNVYDRIVDLTKAADGFDIAIDPASRKLELYYPTRGVDRSTGEDRIVFDARNVTSSNIVCSIAPQDLASEALGSGTGPSTDQTFVATASNEELRARYGRTGVTGTFGQVPNQDALNAYVQAMVDARGSALLIPGPNARVSVDSDIASYDVGDTVDYQLHTTLSVSGAFRIRKRTVSVQETGTESVSVEFV